MPYNINKYNGNLAAVVEDGTVDSTFDVKLVGKNYAGYGEVQNENFVFLLENFANSTEPAKKTTGQVWYDSANKKLKFYDGTKFRTTGGAEVGTAEPTGLSVGDFWFNSSTKQLYAWNGTGFTLVGPQAVADAGLTQLRSRSVVDESDAPHAIIEAIANNATVYVISPDEFTLKTATNPITGFSVIKKGLTLVNTPNTTAGVNVAGVTSTDFRFWGTASNSEKLGGVSASSFVRNDASSYPTVVQRFADVGYTVGNDNDLAVYIDGVVPTVKNQLSDTIIFQTTSSGVKTPLKLVGSDILPGSNNVSNIGSLTAGAGSTPLRFATVYATSFNGTATQADSLNVGGNYRTASEAAGNNTIASRTSSGDLVANNFTGVALQAKYADLAENYLADADYPIGTVLMVGGAKEVTACQVGFRAIGPVSEKPAYLMNSELEGGTAIALKGRVPVRVTGSILKGQRLVAGSNGTAQAAMGNTADVFAIALESNEDAGEKIIEAIIL
jgi:hypothetical protein